MEMKKNITSFIVGFIFAIGLAVAGMTQPQKVIGFLDIFGQWNPALMTVMIGAIIFHSISFHLIKHRESPILGGNFHLPTSKDIDWKLITGASIFGVGWGIGGFCPGPAFTSLGSGNQESYIFVFSMLIGMGTFRVLQPFINR